MLKSARLKVLHVVPNLDMGGGSLCSIELVHLLCRSGNVDARLCVMGAVEETSIPGNEFIHIVSMNFRGSHKKVKEYLNFRRKLRALINEWKPEYVHCHLWPACRWVSMALIDVDVVHVWHVHDTAPWLYSNSIRSRGLRFLVSRLVSRVNPMLVAVSESVAEYAAVSFSLSPKSFHRIPCGVDTKRFGPRTRCVDSDIVIGMAAQFRPEKRHDVLIKAVKILVDKGYSIRLEFAGNGELLDSARNLCKNLRMDGVEFNGIVEDMPGFLSKLDILVLSSTREGLPRCILEAMSMGIVVVATNVGGVSEAVVDGVTGFLVEPLNVKSLADGIERAITSRDKLETITAKAMQTIEESYSEQVVLRNLLAAYGRHKSTADGA